jgi:hypothetical protein
MKRTLQPHACDVKQKIYNSTSPTNKQEKLVGWAQKSPGIRAAVKGVALAGPHNRTGWARLCATGQEVGQLQPERFGQLG